jgi:hypothetical protein
MLNLNSKYVIFKYSFNTARETSLIVRDWRGFCNPHGSGVRVEAGTSTGKNFLPANLQNEP